jgi:hypothetical protein
MSETTKARKGDLILVERVSRNCYSLAAYAEAKAAGRTLPDVETDYQFGVVASATRDGQVKTWRSIGWGDELLNASDQPIRYDRRWVKSAKCVDVTGVLVAAKAHHWPGHPGQPMPFDTFEQARDFARKFASKERAG